jgi:hypothetical protein
MGGKDCRIVAETTVSYRFVSETAVFRPAQPDEILATGP